MRRSRFGLSPRVDGVQCLCCVNCGVGGFGRVPVALVHVQQFVCQLWLGQARAPHC